MGYVILFILVIVAVIIIVMQAKANKREKNKRVAAEEENTRLKTHVEEVNEVTKEAKKAHETIDNIPDNAAADITNSVMQKLPRRNKK